MGQDTLNHIHKTCVFKDIISHILSYFISPTKHTWTPNPKPKNPKPQTQNPKPQTLKSLHPKP